MSKLTVDQLPLEDLKKLGITLEVLEHTNNMNQILSGRKTNLLNIRGKALGLEISGQAKLFLRNNAEGVPELRLELVRKCPDLQAPIYGTSLTKQQKTALADGETVKIKCNTKYGEIELLVSLDPDTSQINTMNPSKVSIPNEVAGVQLTEQQKTALADGKKILIHGMTNRNGKSFDSYISYNVALRNLVFLSGKNKKKETTNSKRQSL